jgi:hypothetical protein
MPTLALLAALAGTYAGSFSCNLQGAAVTDRPSLVAISELSQDAQGLRLVAEIDGVRYGGRAAGNDAALTRCGALNPSYGERAGELESVALGIDPNTGAPTLHVGARTAFGPCEATWTRIDATDPRIPACGQ